MRHPPRGVAASGFPPLCNIPHCCLPQESGPCLSSSVADHPLRPARRHSLGEPLPHQQTDTVQPHPLAINLSRLTLWQEGVWGISSRFQLLSPTKGQVSYILLTRAPLILCPYLRTSMGRFIVRLACVKHAASVHSEPGSNSPLNCLLVQEQSS